MVKALRGLSVAVALLTVWPFASCVHAAGDDDADRGPALRIPGMPPIPLPPSNRVFSDGDSGGETITGGGAPYVGTPGEDDARRRPDIFRNFGAGAAPRRRLPSEFSDRPYEGPGHRAGLAPVAPPKSPTPAERDAAIRKALAPKPPLAETRRRTLDQLYTKLAAASDEDEAKGLATLIGNIWMRSGSDTATLLMQRSIQAIEKKDYPLAETLLGRIVVLQPTWAEAWNKRASVRYLTGDLDGSMADVEHVLKLEPRHYGALEGMATMLQRAGLNKRALEVYRRALAVYPHQPEIEKIVGQLTLEVEGQGI